MRKRSSEYLRESTEAPSRCSDVFSGSRGLALWDPLGRHDLDPTRRQRSACACVHTEVAASPFSENSRSCHFQQGLGRHQDCLCVWSPMSNVLSSCFQNAYLTFLYLNMIILTGKTNSTINLNKKVNVTSDSLPRIRTRVVLEAVLRNMSLPPTCCWVHLSCPVWWAVAMAGLEQLKRGLSELIFAVSHTHQILKKASINIY